MTSRAYSRIGSAGNLLAAVVVALLPFPLKRFLLRVVWGHDIHSSAHLGISLILVDQLKMAPGSRIGHFVLCKGLTELTLGRSARIGKFNWITAVPPSDRRFYLHQPERESVLRMGDHSAITSRHLIDCTNAVRVGKFSTIAGYGSQVLTHSVDLVESRQNSRPIEIGDYCFVGTDCVLLGGSKLPSYSVLGAKSLLNREWEDEGYLYGGVPAKQVKPVEKTWRYFHRETGVIY